MNNTRGYHRYRNRSVNPDRGRSSSIILRANRSHSQNYAEGVNIQVTGHNSRNETEHFQNDGEGTYGEPGRLNPRGLGNSSRNRTRQFQNDGERNYGEPGRHNSHHLGHSSGSRTGYFFQNNEERLKHQGRYNRFQRNAPSDSNARPRERRDHATRIGFKYLQSLLEKPVEEVMSKIIENKGFFEMLAKPLSPDYIILITRLISHLCECDFSSVRSRILQKCMSDEFINSIQTYIASLAFQTKEEKRRNSFYWEDSDSFWNNFLKVCRTTLKEMPQGYCDKLTKLLKMADFNIPQIESTHCIHICDATKEEIKSQIETAEAIFSELEKKNRKAIALDEDEGEPPDDFRDISVYPTTIELISDCKRFLRKNVVKGPYRDVDHYLDVQFRLLREDFIGPLRDGIKAHLSNTNNHIQNVKIHKNVHFLHPITATEHYCLLLKFNFSKKNLSFSYENSRRFMYGSLVCFTRNEFQSIIFGKIVDRDEKYLKNGQIVVGFDHNENLLFNTNYTMVECSVYFEPYYHVLSVMKEMTDENFPMQDYIIEVSTRSVLPKYVSENTVMEVDDNRVVVVDLLTDENIQFHSFNSSQNTAFRAALTREFSIIQGPPGTGKTFVGLKIAQELLRNSSTWYHRTPMLVICYTNHALDQFLEGLLNTTEEIVRIGGQSKNEKLSKFNLRNHRYKMSQGTFQAKLTVKNYLSEIKTITDTLGVIRNYDSIINFASFRGIIPNFENSWFDTATRDDVMGWLFGTGHETNYGTENLLEELKNLKIDEFNQVQKEESEEDNVSEDERFLRDQNLEEEFDIKVSRMEPLLTLQDLHLEMRTCGEKIAYLRNLLENENYEIIFEYRNLEIQYGQLQKQFNYLKNYLYLGANGLCERPLIDIRNSQNIPRNDRWNLYFHWLKLYEEYLLKRYDIINERFRKAYVVFNELKDMENIKILRDMKVIGLTTTGAARLHSSLQTIKSPIVIVEEAAEVLEAHIITSLTKHCQQLILIGDHQQLKPSTSNYQIEKFYKLGISMFERMILNDVQCFTLNIQHRMRPEISSLITPAIYPNLEDHESVLDRPPIKGIDKCLYFIDHTNPEESGAVGTSKKNLHEVKFLIRLARYLILNGYKADQITILAAYLGQMFEFQKERTKYKEHLKDVRIAVLDNYQGEECDIILLSLVRNNSINKIGFLSIENRVCVALSRARDGLYIMGNMSLLCEQSELWPKIEETLTKQNAVGRALTLKCQNHGKLTKVSEIDDFLAVAEGGCDQLCGMLLACQHNCQSMCHVIDREHALYKCQENCTKVLCDDNSHICKKKCYVDCGSCEYLVTRDLPCDHKAAMFCSTDVTNYKCVVEVLITLLCGHETQKPCHIDGRYWKCPFKCDTRLECGHACLKNCHIRDDPDHLEYKCPKPCEKPPVGCTNPEKDGHTCPKLCWDECVPCKISVRKFRTICPHVYDVPCFENVDELTCVKPCKNDLPCGHRCKKLCNEVCGPCNIKVKKEIPDCKHKVTLFCHVEPDKIHCSGKCTRLMSCGHKCTRNCKEICDPAYCKEKVKVSLLAKCGHVVDQIPCNIYMRYQKEEEIDLESYCTRPCNELLNCGPKDKHHCKGTCGECFQGRIHKRCGEKCGQPLVCNHLCEIPCRETCKPCLKPCGFKCRHSSCKKQCGEPCIKCREECSRRCKHQKCKNKCGDICSVPPCEEPCHKKLKKCGHPCIGFCGDPCPPLCRICDKEEVETCFFGTEDEDSSFVLLKDCGHVLESSGMEQWLAQDENEIKFKVCPMCKTTINTTERYSDYVKKAIDDIIKVKEKHYGNREQINVKRKELKLKFGELLKGVPRDYFDEIFCEKRSILMQRLLVKDAKGRLQHMNLVELDSMEIKYKLMINIRKILQTCQDNYLIRISSKTTTKIATQLKFIFQIMLRKVEDITTAEIEDLQREISRLNRMVQLALMFHGSPPDATSQPNIKHKVDELTTTIYSFSKYENTLDARIKVLLEDLKKELKSAIGISEAEKQTIIKAVGLSQGHWFKCPNGHPYAIGECGGAMQVSRCYECRAPIGGNNHALLRTNSLASDFDGARHAAWSNMQNMVNFDLRDLD